MSNIWFNNLKLVDKRNQTRRCLPSYFSSNEKYKISLASNDYFNRANFDNGIIVPFLLGSRLKFKGKTIRGRRLFEKNYMFRVGTTHPALAKVEYGVFIKLTAKQKMVSWSFSQKALISNNINFMSLKKPNLYHGRGIRPTRLSLFWKAGKVSEYFK